MDTLERYAKSDEANEISRILAFFCGTFPIFGMVVTVINLLDGYARRAFHCGVVVLIGSAWWYFIMFGSLPTHKSDQAYYALFLFSGLLISPLVIVMMLRRVIWPRSRPVEAIVWRRKFFTATSVFFLGLFLLVLAAWLNLLPLGPGKADWSNCSIFSAVEDSRYENKLLFAGWCCIRNIDIRFLGLSFSSGGGGDCLWNLKVPFWLLMAATVIASTASFLLRNKTLGEWRHGRPPSKEKGAGG